MGWQCENEQIFGERSYITEHLSGLSFRVSPTAFFQVNTLGAEKLYALIKDWVLEEAGERADQCTVFDICCGTGTIGITLAQSVKRVVGLELVPEAVRDAWQNAKDNHVTNATFVAGRAEHTLKAEVKKVRREEEGEGTKEVDGMTSVGVLDPPRSGLHKDTIKVGIDWRRGSRGEERGREMLCF